MRITNLILFIGVIVTLSIYAPLTAFGQSCSGHWVNNHPLTYQCISGQQIGIPLTGNDPTGCPINPIYTSLQTNTFVFDNPINVFFVDFNAFDSGPPPGCPRMQIKIHDLFFPITATNLIELPMGTSCSGSVSFLTITSDGYITTVVAQSNGQGRLVFSGVNASSITISTNDRAGIVIANPCFAPLPIQIKSFRGYATSGCEVKLEFESGIESNVRNIEVEGSFDGAAFSKLLEVSPQGSDSRYAIQCKSSGNNFYRLKINDLDGNFSYSEIIRVSNNCASSSFRIYPNPSSQKILVENVQRDDQLIIVDMMGREVFRQQAMSNSTEINIQHLSSGLYFLKLYRKNVKLETAKFLKR